MKFKICILALLFSLFSCVPKKEIIYLQGNAGSNSEAVNYEPKIQSDDLLSINVLTIKAELSEPFNLKFQTNNTSSNIPQGYLVDQNGEIEFPVLGRLKVSGFTKSELKQLLKEKLALYISNPIVDIKILNFKVSVLGEVKSPGVVTFNGDRITLLDAIASCGDLTTTGKRDNILIVRDFQGTKTFNRVDITKAEFVNSPFYYLDQNDVVYIEARKSKIDSTPIIGSNVTTIISLLGVLLTSTIILTRL